MNEKVQKFLDARKKEEDVIKAQFLIDLGLYGKVYSPDNRYSTEYSSYEMDENNKARYFKKVAIEVTDEEFEAIKRSVEATTADVAPVANKKQDDYSIDPKREKNSVARALSLMAWCIILVGFFLGFLKGTAPSSVVMFNLSAAAPYFFLSIVFGIGFLGLAEIINLLTDIKNK